MIKKISYLKTFELSQMETNTGWQAADARRPSAFRLCWSVRLILESVRQPAAVLPSDTLASVYTSHAGSLQSRRQDFTQSHLLETSPLFHLPCETIRLFFFFFFFIPLSFSFTARDGLSYNPAWLQSSYSWLSSQSELLTAIICTTTLPLLLVV